ncbi:MAG: hypothetical protein R6T91_04765 [Bacteroidales bacterium]
MQVQEINNIFCQNKQQKAILAGVCDQLKHKYAVNAYFCQITGKRWAFLAGSGDVEIPRYRYKLTDNIGIIAEDVEHLKADVWNDIVNALIVNINNKDYNYDI